MSIEDILELLFDEDDIRHQLEALNLGARSILESDNIGDVRTKKDYVTELSNLGHSVMLLYQHYVDIKLKEKLEFKAMSKGRKR